MQLTNEQLKQVNVEVDSYSRDGETFTCYTMCAGIEYEDKEVTILDLMKHVTNGKGLVEVMDGVDDYKEITFGEWLHNNHLILNADLEDIINKREGRNPLSQVVDFPETPKLNIYINEVKTTELS